MPVDDPSSTASLKGSAKDFYLKEYECLRKEVEWLLKDYRALERNVVIAVGVTLGWLFDKRSDIPAWAWFLPFLFAALGAIRGTGIMQAFGNFKKYFLAIENAFSRPGDPAGWEHFPRQEGSTSRVAVVFWALLLLVTAVIGGYQYCVSFRSLEKTHSSVSDPQTNE